MFKSILLVFSGNAVNAALLLLRNIIIARIISVEDYGLAATFAVAVSIIEMTSTFGLQQLLIQDKRGNDPSFQAALQGFNLLRGMVNAAVLFLLAEPFVSFMGVPQIAWAHRLLAVILLMNGLLHFDAHRLNRTMDYLPATLIAFASPLGALLAVWPLYVAFGDYRVMLWSMIIQSATNAIVSHLVAKRPYRISFNREIIAQSMRFGWPLLIDGLLLFVIFNGEKLIIGRELGMEPLALFTMAITLTFTPALILQKTASSFFLPQLSATTEVDRFRHLAIAAVQSHLFFGGFLVAGVVVCGAPFVHLVLGEKYQDIVPLLTLLAIMQALRMMKGGGATVSLARARTSNGMLANILRIAVLPFAWYAAATGSSVIVIIWIGIAGEGLGLLVSLGIMRAQLRFSLRPVLIPLLIMLGILTIVGTNGAGLLTPGLQSALVLVVLLSSLFFMGDLRRYISDRTIMHHGD